MSNTSYNREIDKLKSWDILYTKIESFYVMLVRVPKTSGGTARAFTESLFKLWFEQKTGQSVKRAIRPNATLGDMLTPEISRDVLQLTKEERKHGERIRKKGNASLHEGMLLTPSETKDLASSVITLWNAFIRSTRLNPRKAIIFQNFWNEVERDRHEYTIIMETLSSFDPASSLAKQLEEIVSNSALETMDHVEAMRKTVKRLEQEQQKLSESIVRKQKIIQLTTMQKWQEQAKQMAEQVDLIRHQLVHLERERHRLEQVEQKVQQIERVEKGNRFAIRMLREKVNQVVQGAEGSFRKTLLSITTQLDQMQTLQMENSKKEKERERKWQHLLTQVEALDDKYEAYEVSASLKKGLEQNVEKLLDERDGKLEQLEKQMENTMKKIDAFEKEGVLHSEASAHLLTQELEQLLEEEKKKNRTQTEAWNERQMWFEERLKQLAQLSFRIESVEHSLAYLKRVDKHRYKTWQQQMKEIPSHSHFVEQEQTLLAVTKTIAEIDKAVEALEKTARHQKQASNRLTQKVEQLQEIQETVTDDTYNVRKALQQVEQSVYSLESDRNKLDEMLANYRKEQQIIWEDFKSSERLLNDKVYQSLLRLIHQEKRLFDQQFTKWNEQVTNWGFAHEETNEQLQSLTSQIQALEKRTSDLEERMESVEEQLSEHNEAFNHLEEEIQEVRDEVNTLGQTNDVSLNDDNPEMSERQRKKEARPVIKTYHNELKDIWKQLKKDRTHASLVLAQSRIKHLLEQQETNELLAYDDTIPVKTDELIVYVKHLEKRYSEVLKAYQGEKRQLESAKRRVNNIETLFRSRNRSITKSTDAWLMRIAHEENLLQTKLDNILFHRAPVLALMGKETNRLQKKLYTPLDRWEEKQKKRATQKSPWSTRVAAASVAIVGLTGGTFAWNTWTDDKIEPASVAMEVEEKSPSLPIKEQTSPQTTEREGQKIEQHPKQEINEDDFTLLGGPTTKHNEVKQHISSLNENDIGSRTTIEGRVTNTFHHEDGHLFLTVSDDSGTINVAFFSSHFQVLPIIEKGDTVRVSGRIDGYNKQLEMIPYEKEDLQFVPLSF